MACFGEMFGTTTDKSHFKVARFGEMFGTTLDKSIVSVKCLAQPWIYGYVYMLSGSFR